MSRKSWRIIYDSCRTSKLDLFWGSLCLHFPLPLCRSLCITHFNNTSCCNIGTLIIQSVCLAASPFHPTAQPRKNRPDSKAHKVSLRPLGSSSKGSKFQVLWKITPSSGLEMVLCIPAAWHIHAAYTGWLLCHYTVDPPCTKDTVCCQVPKELCSIRGWEDFTDSPCFGKWSWLQISMSTERCGMGNLCVVIPEIPLRGNSDWT